MFCVAFLGGKGFPSFSSAGCPFGMFHVVEWVMLLAWLFLRSQVVLCHRVRRLVWSWKTLSLSQAFREAGFHHPKSAPRACVQSSQDLGTSDPPGDSNKHKSSTRMEIPYNALSSTAVAIRLHGGDVSDDGSSDVCMGVLYPSLLVHRCGQTRVFNTLSFGLHVVPIRRRCVFFSCEVCPRLQEVVTSLFIVCVCHSPRGAPHGDPCLRKRVP